MSSLLLTFAPCLTQCLVKSVPTAQEFFDMNEFADSSRQAKPRIYISPEEVIQVHRNLELYIEELVRALVLIDMRYFSNIDHRM